MSEKIVIPAQPAPRPMKYSQTFELPDGFEVTLSYDGELIHWRWVGLAPASLTLERRRKVEACYLLARATFLRDLATVLAADEEPAA